MLKVTDLSYGYNRNAKILQDINFTVKDGECLAILGNNGVGKSTLLKCINGIIKPGSGKVIYKDNCLDALSRKEVAKQVAFVGQKAASAHLKVIDILALGRCPYVGFALGDKDKARIDTVIRELRLESFLDKYLDELSGGEEQRVMIARALVQEPQILLLDEPTSNLDIKHKQEILEMINSLCKRKQIVVIIVLHDINLALKYCDKFLLLKDGQIYKMGAKEIITKEVMKSVFDIDSRVIEIEGNILIT